MFALSAPAFDNPKTDQIVATIAYKLNFEGMVVLDYTTLNAQLL